MLHSNNKNSLNTKQRWFVFVAGKLEFLSSVVLFQNQTVYVCYCTYWQQQQKIVK